MQKTKYFSFSLQRSIWRNFAIATGIAINCLADDRTNSTCKNFRHGSHRHPFTGNAIRRYVKDFSEFNLILTFLVEICFLL